MIIKDTIAEEFNAFSENYTNDMVCCVPNYLKLLNSFVENLPKTFQPTQILDLGCGNGNVTNILLSKFPDAEYTLVDASEEMLTLCKKRFSKHNINYANSYFKDFDFKKDNFDMIVAGFSLHHCKAEELQILYKKIFYSLKSGGVFSCSDLMIDKTQEVHNALLEDWKTFVYKSFPDGEKWKWLMEHYNEFDNPDSLTNHLAWLNNAEFEKYSINIYDTYWTHFRAYK